MKYKVNRVLEELDDEWDFFAKKEKLVDISFSMQIEYMYEYVKFLNIVGRPIILETAEKFWDILENSKEKEEKTEYKIQYIYLQLLRAYRELADWEKYDLCRAKILESTLKYEEKQFLYSNDWWMKMYRFKDVNLIDLLNKWDLAQGDLYWPIIKSSMYAIAGEKVKGEQILGEILPKIRQQLVKNSKDEYLCSIEECIVSLLNFMRQGDWQVNLDAEMEACIQTGDVNWWGENEEYCSHLNEKEDKKPETSVQTNYDLSITYTSHMGRCNSKIYYALDYLRFLEQTGHPFRIQMVTNTKGFQRVIETLYLYYPQWCLIQILIAQNEKELDMLFGRNKLSGMTQEEVDNCIQEYIKALDLVSKNIKPENANWSTSVYDNSAKILPQIISRLCYKCSIEILDQILDYMLILCSSNVRDNFKGINKILELLLEKLNISEDIYTNMEEKLWLHSEEDINLLQIFYLETSRIKIDIKQMKRFGTFSNMVYQMAIYRIINTEISNVMPVLRLLYALVVNNIIVERETKLLFINLPRLMKDTTIGVEDFEKEARHKLNCRREICVIVSEYYKKGERNNNVLEWMELTKNSNEFVEIRNIEFE